VSSALAYRPQTSDIPTRPGVYRFFHNDRILYVGKAKNLRARITSYFAPLNTLHERTRRMVTTANRVEWVIVDTEFEALQLEFTWIKQFDPPFNIQFKDDKSYPYLAISMSDEIPRAFITRRRGQRGTVYFGPYTKAWAIRETLDTILKPFPVRSCSDSAYAKARKDGRPCLLGDIGKCAAPCVDRVTPTEHKKLAQDMATFLQGKNDDLIEAVRSRMIAASENQDYERAARLRDNIAALESVAAKSVVVLPSEVDADVFGVARDSVSAAVTVFLIRGGRVRGVRSWTVDADDDVTTGEFIDSLLRSAYQDDDAPARLVIVPEVPDDAAALEEWLSQQRRSAAVDGRTGGVELRRPQRGDMVRLAETVSQNAAHSLMLYKSQRSNDYVARSQALGEIQAALGLDEAPLRIECFDVSHLAGTNIVASMVVFEDGLAKRNHYRKFNIADSTDDTESMRQVLTRRLAYLTTPAESAEPEEFDRPTKKSFEYPPGLIIVDGGIPQVNAAISVIREAGLKIPVCGLAKRLEELWIPGDEFPVILPRGSSALFMMQQIRDEAHRFAITFQRAKRKKDIKTVLSDIPGVGPAKVSALLKHFGSVAQIRSASVADVAEAPGITTALANTIVATLASSQSGDSMKPTTTEDTQ
jgi:excinuclease ABC subunit C